MDPAALRRPRLTGKGRWRATRPARMMDRLDVTWEVTRACDLACRHCRSLACPSRDFGELTTQEGERLIDDAASLGSERFTFTGGDPLRRKDLARLIRRAADRSLPTCLSAAATPRLTDAALTGLNRAGLGMVGLALDFPHEQRHDAMRGSPGSFRATMRLIGWAHRLQIPVRVETLIWRGSAFWLRQMAALVARVGASVWRASFLVPAGQAARLEGLDGAECEEAFEVLRMAGETGLFRVEVAEAPHYRRYLLQNGASSRVRRPATEVFVGSLGQIQISPWLPTSAGNVRVSRLGEILESSTLFRRLRHPELLGGACGRCRYNRLCGGSRARAWAITGDPFGAEPWCASTAGDG